MLRSILITSFFSLLILFSVSACNPLPNIPFIPILLDQAK